MQFHVVTFVGDSERELGLDAHNPFKSTVCSARQVLERIKSPTGNPKDHVVQYDLEQYRKAVEFLRELDEFVVNVCPFGLVVGEFSVTPFLLTMRDVAVLAKAYAEAEIHGYAEAEPHAWT
jgi:hypothetical protein